MKILNTGLIAAVAALSVFASTGTALAWGCVAVAGDGTYGYSYNYGDRDDAIDRALNECASRTTSDQTCEITDCDEGS